MKLTKHAILDLCNLADLVEVGDERAEITIELTGKEAQIVQGWCEDNERRDEQDCRRELARIERLAKQGNPWAVKIMEGRRAIAAQEQLLGRSLTLDEREAITKPLHTPMLAAPVFVPARAAAPTE